MMMIQSKPGITNLGLQKTLHIEAPASSLSSKFDISILHGGCWGRPRASATLENTLTPRPSGQFIAGCFLVASGTSLLLWYPGPRKPAVHCFHHLASPWNQSGQYLQSMELVLFPMLWHSLPTAMIQMSREAFWDRFLESDAKCKEYRDDSQTHRMWLGLQVGQAAGQRLLPGSWVDGQATWLIIQDVLLLEDPCRTSREQALGCWMCPLNSSSFSSLSSLCFRY